MDSKIICLFLLCFSFSANPAFAETYESFVNKHGSGETFEATIGFNSSCGEECHVADMTCGANAAINFSLNGFSPKAAAALVSNEKRTMVVTVGSTNFDATLMKLEFEGEMTGEWAVSGSLNGSASDFFAALRKAKTVKARFGTQSLALPVDKNVLAWTKACVK